MKFNLGNIEIFPANYFFDFMKWSRYTIAISVIAVVLSIGVVVKQGINYSIDFLGGAQIELEAPTTLVHKDDLQQVTNQLQLTNVEITQSKSEIPGQTHWVVRIPKTKNEVAAQIGQSSSQFLDTLGKKFTVIQALAQTPTPSPVQTPSANQNIQVQNNISPDMAAKLKASGIDPNALVSGVKSGNAQTPPAPTPAAPVATPKVAKSNAVQIVTVSNISGKVGKEEEYKGYMSIFWACIGIFMYIMLRFDARFAPGAILCLLHNVIIAFGLMNFLGKYFTNSSAAAFLTIIGYTINDTVIVYDRIREMQVKFPKMSVVDTINNSISQMMNRTVLTSTIALIALVTLVLVGKGSISDFALTMFIGVLVGTYSSIYVAAPLTVFMDGYLAKFKIFDYIQNSKKDTVKAKVDKNIVIRS
jgi:preprotein translocase SecF subunit